MAAKKKPPLAAPPLNPEQQAVVAHTYGPLRVIAVAGSGKSTALIERTVSLVKNHGVAPSDILLISFSVNARNVMEKRLGKRLPHANADAICRTFHSIGFDIFKHETPDSRDWMVDNAGRLYTRALTTAMRQIGVGGTTDDKMNLTVLKHFASRCKTDMLCVAPAVRRLGTIDAKMKELADQLCAGTDMEGDALISVFHRAEDIRESGELLDAGLPVRFVTFDDMVHMAAMLLRKKDVKARWAARWKFVMQDETQDENEVQAEISEALCSTHQNYAVVGDPSQSVFGFRGARPERLLNFDQVWLGTKTVAMHRNYRSGIEIVDAANRLMDEMPEGTILPGVVMHSERQTHAHIECHRFSSRDSEAEAISKNILRHHEQGTEWKDQAVLVRMKFLTRAIEVQLAMARTPYRLVSGTSFFSLREVAMLYGYLRVAAKRATAADVEVALMYPSRMLSRAFVEKVVSAYDLRKQQEPDSAPDWLDCAKECEVYLNPKQRFALGEWIGEILIMRSKLKVLTPYQVLAAFNEMAKTEEWLAKGAETGEDNQSVGNFHEAMDFASGFSETSALLDRVDEINAFRKSNSHVRNYVTIVTAHSAKGSEFQVVYVPGCENGLFPAKKADVNEERRLFYVALTRAEDEAWFSYAVYAKDDEEGQASLFLEEAGIRVVAGEDFAPGRVIAPVKLGSQMELI